MRNIFANLFSKESAKERDEINGISGAARTFNKDDVISGEIEVLGILL